MRLHPGRGSLGGEIPRDFTEIARLYANDSRFALPIKFYLTDDNIHLRRSLRESRNESEHAAAGGAGAGILPDPPPPLPPPSPRSIIATDDRYEQLSFILYCIIIMLNHQYYNYYQLQVLNYKFIVSCC